MSTEWKTSVEGQWFSVLEEWTVEREEWESEVKSVENNLGTVTAKFSAGLASLEVLQHQQRHQRGPGVGIGNGGVVKFIPRGSSGQGGLVTPRGPRSLTADSDRLRRGGGLVGGVVEVEPIDRRAESKSRKTST
jgi:hypothetical protein